jgi:hypothetical protein
MRPAQLPAWLLLATLIVIALVRAVRAGAAQPQRALSVPERQALGAAAAAQEPTWRLASRRNFPGDMWSQDDDFHSMERAWVNAEAQQRGVSPREVFRAIDEDLHAHPPSPPRKATASPCKPRSFYD